MADPVTNVEIEDVLSSIRRLVSDEARASSRGEQDQGFKSDVPPQPVELQEEEQFESPRESAKSTAPALVLTAALRVETFDNDSASNSVEAEHDASGESAEDADVLILSDASDGEEAPHQEDNTVEDAGDTAEQMLLEDIVEDEVETKSDTHEQEAVEEAEPQFEPQLEQSDTFENADEPEGDDEPRSIEDKIAALEALISDTETDFEPDGVEDGANAARSGDALPWEDTKDSNVGQPDPVMPDPDAASQSVSFDEEAIAFQRAHAEAVETAQEELGANATETLLENDDIGAVLDEEALRDMVAEIVRQELQGPLGERITRNVRKLVRREIYRALAANELD